jgi:hypothetical protein
MKSAFECFQHVAKCQRQVFEAITESGRIALLATATHWRMLGDQAKATEAKKLQERLAAPLANAAVRPPVKRPDSGVQKSYEVAVKGAPQIRHRGQVQRSSPARHPVLMRLTLGCPQSPR